MIISDTLWFQVALLAEVIIINNIQWKNIIQQLFSALTLRLKRNNVGKNKMVYDRLNRSATIGI